MDLTKNPNSYVYHLANMKPSISDLCYDANCSFEGMTHAVSVAVHKAKPTPARQRFLDYLFDDCYTKRQIETLCSNAIARGKNYQG